MSIKENLLKAREAIIRDVNALGVAKEVREAAIAAITHGLRSEHGRKYMALFCDTRNELAQMTVERDDDDDYMPQMRAYTPSDPICTPETNTGFAARVLRPGINLEPLADAFVPEDIPEPSAIRDNDLVARLRQG